MSTFICRKTKMTCPDKETRASKPCPVPPKDRNIMYENRVLGLARIRQVSWQTRNNFIAVLITSHKGVLIKNGLFTIFDRSKWWTTLAPSQKLLLEPSRFATPHTQKNTKTKAAIHQTSENSHQKLRKFFMQEQVFFYHKILLLRSMHNHSIPSWKYHTADELGGTSSYWGQIATYSGNGYYQVWSLSGFFCLFAFN